MKVTFANVVLAAGGREGPRNLRGAETEAVQTVDYVRAKHGGQFARGNRRREISFEVSRVHRSTRDAVTFWMDHPGAVPSSGTLQFYAAGEGGSVRRWWAKAVLMRVEPLRLVGLTTEWAYTFLTSESLASDPDKK